MGSLVYGSCSVWESLDLEVVVCQNSAGELRCRCCNVLVAAFGRCGT